MKGVLFDKFSFKFALMLGFISAKLFKLGHLDIVETMSQDSFFVYDNWNEEEQIEYFNTYRELLLAVAEAE
jgi:hypothetical protein